MIKINGKEISAQGRTVAQLLTDEGYDISRIAVEMNGGILPKAQYGLTLLEEGDSLEVVSFVGGG